MSIEDSAATRLFTVADAAENASAELRTKHEIKFDNCHFELSLRQFYVKMKGVQTLTFFFVSYHFSFTGVKIRCASITID